jgi:hypothetical protein
MGDSASSLTPSSLPRTPKELEREPLVLNQRSLGWLTNAIAGIGEKTPKWWWALFIPSVLLAIVMFSLIAYLMTTGVGVWGLKARLTGRGISRTSSFGSASVTRAR